MRDAYNNSGKTTQCGGTLSDPARPEFLIPPQRLKRHLDRFSDGLMMLAKEENPSSAKEEEE